MLAQQHKTSKGETTWVSCKDAKKMKISNLYYPKTKYSFKAQSNVQSNVSLPTQKRNYCIFDQKHVDEVVSQREKALPQLKETLRTSTNEKEIVETLYIIDKMADAGVKGIPAMYPDLAKFNNTQSPNIQVFLAGIYRKTQVPDAFGPLCSMLIKNSTKNNDGGIVIPPYSTIATPSDNTKKPQIQPPNHLPPSFDANEEIGGAILEYIRNYSNNPKPIDYSA